MLGISMKSFFSEEDEYELCVKCCAHEPMRTSQSKGSLSTFNKLSAEKKNTNKKKDVADGRVSY